MITTRRLIGITLAAFMTIAILSALMPANVAAAPLSADSQLDQAISRGYARTLHGFNIYTNEKVSEAMIVVAIRKTFLGARPKCTKSGSTTKCKFLMYKGDSEVKQLYRRTFTIKPYLDIKDRVHHSMKNTEADWKAASEKVKQGLINLRKLQA